MKKQYRIKKSYEFESILKSGQHYSNASFVLYVVARQETQARIGIGLSKKIGHAVDRNRYKRQIRMLCQETIDFDTFPFDAILIARNTYKTLTYETNKKNLEKLLIKATMK